MNAKLFDIHGLTQSPVSTHTTGTALTLADRSLWPRAGVKGANATEWLTTRGATIPEINMASRQADGSLLVRLAGNEHMSLAASQDAAGPPGGLPDFDFDGDNPPGICPVPRFAANAWFLLTGAALAEMFAKVCSVDLRRHKFVNHRVAQTVVARTTAILVRDDQDDLPCFHIVFDWTTATYLWDALADAIDEFNGG
jgi:sarcosine oxidase subunit gamma